MTPSQQIAAIIALVAAAVVVALIAFAVSRRHAEERRARLQEQFGPEYNHAVDQLGSQTRAERELIERKRRVEHFRFNPLTPGDRARFSAAWNHLQADFVDDPVVSVTRANELINQVMRARGYPVEHFEQRVADLSVEHPTVVQHYRAAHELARSVHNGTVDTENLRQAVVHYRALFAELLQEGSAEAVDWRRAKAS